YRCANGEQSSISGKCIIRSKQKMNYKQVRCFFQHCFQPCCAAVNTHSNLSICAAGSNAVWIQPRYNKRFTGRTSFSRFGVCTNPQSKPAPCDPNWCAKNVA
ncbi:hypothetical protein PFISCL1PPCAC_3421, partial [Pristionchus fissidentatus]